METPAQRIEKALKEWFAKFKKTPFALPAAIALIVGVSYLVFTYLLGVCLAPLITPAVMVAVLWIFDIKQVKKLLIVGFIAVLPVMGVMIIVGINDISNLDSVVSTSRDGALITNGTLEPLYGDDETVFTFNATVTMDNTTVVEEAHVIVYSIYTYYVTYEERNYSMDLISLDSSRANYTCNVSEIAPVNGYVFLFKIDGSWHLAGSVDQLQEVSVVQGPISTDKWAIAVTLIPWGIVSTLLNTFMPFVIICAMIWWVRRARRMRAEAIERMEAERNKRAEELPKDKAKVPSLSSAMGLSKEDMFVCSECGADVPGDAKQCPKCGEKFE